MKVLVLVCCALTVAAAQMINVAIPQQSGQYLQLPQQLQQPVYVPILGPLGVPIEPPEVQNARAAHIIFFNREAARVGNEQQDVLPTSTERTINQISDTISQVQAATGIGQNLIQNTNNNQILSGSTQIITNTNQGVSENNQIGPESTQVITENNRVQSNLGNDQVRGSNNNLNDNQIFSGSSQIILENNQGNTVQISDANNNNANNQVLSGNNQVTVENSRTTPAQTSNTISNNGESLNLDNQFGLKINQMATENTKSISDNNQVGSNNDKIISGNEEMVSSGKNQAVTKNKKSESKNSKASKDDKTEKSDNKKESLNFYLQDTPEVAAAKAEHFVLYHKYAELAAKDNGTWGNGTWENDVEESAEKGEKDLKLMKENVPIPAYAYEQMLGNTEKRQKRSIINKSNEDDHVGANQRLNYKSPSSSTHAPPPAITTLADTPKVPKVKAQHRAARKYTKTRKIKKHPSPSRAREQRKEENQEASIQLREHQIQRPEYYNEEKRSI